MVRVDFLVDGFNVYHSLRAASTDLTCAGASPEDASTRWLDLESLMRSYLPLLGREATMGRVHYFSAFANHLVGENPHVVRRHQNYIRALKSTGVIVTMGGFKKRTTGKCDACGGSVGGNEEKKTDVAIAMRLIEVFARDEADLAVLVTGDTDQVPAVEVTKELFPERTVYCVFPYKRKNKELAQVSDGSFNISRMNYLNHQFDSPLKLRSGREIERPSAW